MPKEIDTVAAAVEWMNTDHLFVERFKAISVEIGQPMEVASLRGAIALVKLRKTRPEVVAKSGNLKATDEYRLARTTDNATLFLGTLEEVNNTDIVIYDDDAWWFAKGINGKILNNEEEASVYKNAVVVQRKYYDAEDDLTSWIAV
tara:strand:- start:27361 stop:27798 length:438 start_codon:yes stop_codon:yes gene_type:complete